MPIYATFFLVLSFIAGSYGATFAHGAAALLSGVSFAAFLVILVTYAASISTGRYRSARF